jgi:hypothetical protein
MGERVLATLCIGCQRLLATLGQIPQRVLASFANSTYFPEGMTTLHRSCQWLLQHTASSLFFVWNKKKYFGTFQPGDKLALYDCLLE